MRHLLLLLLVLSFPTLASAEPRRWSDDVAGLRQRIGRGEPLVVRVMVPLCDNAQINCGDHGLGNPMSLRTNLYWGAMFGAVSFFEKRNKDYQLITTSKSVEGVLERRVYRRMIDPAVWGRGGTQRVEQVVVLDAVHGARINDAVRSFWDTASSGGTVTFRDGERMRKLTINAAGYAGHNRLMDGVKLLPEQGGIRSSRQAIPSFTFACYSDRYFTAPLEAAGSKSLITTDAFMAPEGYVVEAAVRALGDNVGHTELRRRVVAAYAKWQRISFAQASVLFSGK